MVDHGFPESAFPVLAAGRNHFWFLHRNRIIARALGLNDRNIDPAVRILDLGCGAGAIAHHLSGAGWSVAVADLYASSLALIDPQIEDRFLFDLSIDEVPEEKYGRFDAVILGDVIEHLSRPVDALSRARSFLKKDGRIAVTVPALSCLWSDYDTASGHRKRYDRRTLDRELTDAGYTVEDLRYFMLTPAIILLVQRRIGAFIRQGPKNYDTVLTIHPLANRLMKEIMTVEQRIDNLFRLPFGSSLIGIGRVA